MATQKTSRAGNRRHDRASALIDAAVAILILALALGAAGFAIGTASPSVKATVTAIVSGIQTRGDHEARAFDGE